MVTRPLVTWKNEGRYGPAALFTPEAREQAKTNPLFAMRAFGAPPPAGVTEWGWMSKGEARRKAKELGADFEEV